MWRKGNPSALLEGMQTGAATVENSVEFSHKIKNGTALWPSHSTSGNICEETWNTNLKEYMHSYVQFSVTYNSQNLEAAQVPISKWIDKKAVVHLHNEILLSHKKEENFTGFDSMDGPGKYYAKWYKPEKDK